MLYSKFSDPHRDKVSLISLSNGKQHIVLEPGSWLSRLWEWLRTGTVVIHNAAFDLKFLWSLGFEGYPSNVWDTLLVERVLTSGTFRPCSLDQVVWRYCNIGLNKDIRQTFSNVLGSFTETQLQYAIDDVRHLIPIMKSQIQKCRRQNLGETVDLENSLVPIVAEMEYTGIKFDIVAWDGLVQRETVLAREANREANSMLSTGCVELDLFGMCGNINLDSPLAVKRALMAQGIVVENTEEKTLLDYLNTHPSATAIEHILTYKKSTKRVGFNYPKYINSVTGRIHTTYNQVGADTGRFSSTNPNLQNVPASMEYRQCFGNELGYKYVTADYSQQEPRILAEASQDKDLIETCQARDVHTETAKRLYRTSTITKKQRRVAKTVGLAMSYGAGAETVSKRAGIPMEEAQRVVHYVRTHRPKVGKWAKEQIELTRTLGYVCTLGGRRRYFTNTNEDNWGWANAARNAPIQGTGVDMLKRAMILIDQAIKKRGYDANLLLNVHDELVARCAKEQVGEVVELMEEKMMEAGAYYVHCVPMPVDTVVADTWVKG